VQQRERQRDARALQELAAIDVLLADDHGIVLFVCSALRARQARLASDCCCLRPDSFRSRPAGRLPAGQRSAPACAASDTCTSGPPAFFIVKGMLVAIPFTMAEKR